MAVLTKIIYIFIVKVGYLHPTCQAFLHILVFEGMLASTGANILDSDFQSYVRRGLFENNSVQLIAECLVK